jgi:hypothetical protein
MRLMLTDTTIISHVTHSTLLSVMIRKTLMPLNKLKPKERSRRLLRMLKRLPQKMK